MASSADSFGSNDDDDMTTWLLRTPGGKQAVEGTREDQQTPLPPEEATRVRVEHERAEERRRLEQASTPNAVDDDKVFSDEEFAKMEEEERQARGGNNTGGVPFHNDEEITSIVRAAKARRDEGKK